QELAADSCGAAVMGGREPYVCALAQMALRLDSRPVSWAARPFLPARGTLIRRIEMLRDAKVLGQVPLPRAKRFLLLAVMTAVWLIIAGVKGPPAGSANVIDGPPVVQKDARSP